MNLFTIIPSRQACVEGYTDSRYVGVPLTPIYGCKHIEALFNCEILFPNIVWLNNDHRMLRYFFVDLEPWSSTNIQDGSSSRSARIAKSFMNLKHMCTCGKEKIKSMRCSCDGVAHINKRFVC